MTERIGVVTGGGDCPGLNAVIRAVAKAAAKRGWETIGFLGGYEGILEPQHYIPLDHQKLSGLLNRGGTILGTANRGRFSTKLGHGESRSLPQELIDGGKAGMQKLNIHGLVSIGGDGSLSIGHQLFEGGVPKTIDDDMVAYRGSGMNAVKIAEALGSLKTVPSTGGFTRTARALGVCLGD